MNTKTYPFFVYGTLRPGQGNYHLLEGETTTEEHGIVHGYAMHSNGRFPYLVPTGNKDDIAHGTLIEVPHERYLEIQARLDQLEGCRTGDKPSDRNHYNRILETVTVDDGVQILCWVYVPSSNLPSRLPRVASGDWLNQGALV